MTNSDLSDGESETERGCSNVHQLPAWETTEKSDPNVVVAVVVVGRHILLLLVEMSSLMYNVAGDDCDHHLEEEGSGEAAPNSATSCFRQSLILLISRSVAK